VFSLIKLPARIYSVKKRKKTFPVIVILQPGFAETMKMLVILVLAFATLISAEDDLPQPRVDRFPAFLK